MKNRKTKYRSPYIARKILEICYPDQGLYSTVGDVEEEYSELCETKGLMYARSWYWLEIIKALFNYITLQYHVGGSMIKSYIKLSFRILSRNKLQSFINIFSLSVGTGFAIIIFMFIRYDHSFDTFHENSENIFRTYRAPTKGPFVDDDRKITMVSDVLASTLLDEIPEITQAVRYKPTGVMVRKGDNLTKESIQLLDKGFFDVFTFPVEIGDSQTPLKDLSSVVISKSISKKYFGEENPVGRSLTIVYEKKELNYNVSAVISDAPLNSSFKPEIVIQFENVKDYISPNFINSWDISYSETFVVVDNSADMEQLSVKLAAVGEEYMSSDVDKYAVALQNIEDIHLSPDFVTNLFDTSNPKYTYILSAVGIFLLLIACVNFTTISIGKAVTRFKEVGVRRVLGAYKKQLINQYLGETLLTAFLSLIIGVGIAYILVPQFNSLFDITMPFNPDLKFFLGLAGLVLFAGLVSGLYPALYLSSLKPVNVLRKGIKGRKNLFTRSLVVLQFSLSIILIVSALVINKQMNFLSDQDLGFNSENVIQIATGLGEDNVGENFALFNDQAQSLSNVITVSSSVNPFGITWSNAMIEIPDGRAIEYSLNGVDYDFFEAMDIEIIKGRGFSPDISSDATTAIIVNEKFVELMGWENPIGQSIKTMDGLFNENFVIGVVRNFNFSSLHNDIGPLVLTIDPDIVLHDIEHFGTEVYPLINGNFIVKISGFDTEKTISELEKIWSDVVPESPFEFTFTDERLNQLYAKEKRWSETITFATILAIVIACLGLYGLAMITSEFKTKEIGIRKILGAKISSITGLLFFDLLKLVMLSNFIAWPVSYFIMNIWLQEFAYKVGLSAIYFLSGSIAAIVIAGLSISFTIIRSALSNPIEALRYE